MMKIYSGEDPDTSEALEFLCLAEGGEVTHYDVLSSVPVVSFTINKKLSSTLILFLKEDRSSFF